MSSHLLASSPSSSWEITRHTSARSVAAALTQRRWGWEGSTSKINRQCCTAGRAGLRRGTGPPLQGPAAAGTCDGCESLNFTRCLMGFKAVLVKRSEEQYDRHYQLVKPRGWRRGLVEEKIYRSPSDQYIG